MTREAGRSRLIAEAMSWRGTPYVDCARIKGPNGGVDCLNLLVGAFEGADLIDGICVPQYAPSWHMHRSRELFIEGVEQYCDEVPGAADPQPGDIVMWKFGRCFSHGAICIEWPTVLHAVRDQPTWTEDAARSPFLSRAYETADKGTRPRRTFRLREWC